MSNKFLSSSLSWESASPLSLSSTTSLSVFLILLFKLLLAAANASKKFCNHFHYICLYYRHTHYWISQRQHCTISFSLWWTMVKMAIYTQKCEQKLLKINNRWVGIKMSWLEKNRKINSRGWTIIRDSRVIIEISCGNSIAKSNEFTNSND